MYKVFIADDEPFIIEGLHYIVDWQEFGLEIVGSAPDGAAALEALKRQRADMLITDISMPRMNGLELIREAREMMPELKVIVLSGFNEFDYLKEGMKLGIENYLLKPINVQELKETLQVAADKLRAPKVQRWLDNDIGILRENILNRWVTGRISMTELKERASLLQIDIKSPSFMTAIIRCGNHERQPVIAAELENDSGTTAFRDFEGDTVLLFALRDSEAGRTEALAAIQSLQMKLAPYKPRISVGLAEAGTAGAALSYNQARGAQAYFLIRSEEEIMDCARLEPGNGEDRSSYVVPWPQYVKLIHAGDEEGLERRIEEDIEQLRSEPGITPAGLRSALADLLQQFRSELRSDAQADQQLLYFEELESVNRLTDIGDLIALVRQAGRRLLDSLDRESKSPVIVQLLERLHNSYMEPLSLKQFGFEYNVHPVYLGQLFQKEIGTSFNDYLNRYRIDKAKELLRESRHKVHEIAQSVGYLETGYFYKQFKKYVGISPLEYKELR